MSPSFVANMLRPRAALLASVAFFSVLVGEACGGSTRTSGFTDEAGIPSDADAGSNGDAAEFGDVGVEDGGAVTTPGQTRLYAHDSTKLYAIDPMDPKLAAKAVGTFDCVGGQTGSMTDLAVDKDGRLFGVASNTVFLDMKIVGATVKCKQNAKALRSGAKYYGASFAPAGTLHPTDETLLVGNTDGQIFQIDTSSGNETLVGSFGKVPSDDGNGHAFLYPGTTFEMSGDIVFVANGGAPIGFATVRDCQSPPSPSNCNPTDTLVQVDLAKMAAGPAGNGVTVRGQIVKAANCSDTSAKKYGSMFGIAAFGNRVVGFGKGGMTVDIDNGSGAACLVASNGPLWDGAGVTTSVKVVAPPPK